jgi:hypothetical protein
MLLFHTIKNRFLSHLLNLIIKEFILQSFFKSCLWSYIFICRYFLHPFINLKNHSQAKYVHHYIPYHLMYFHLTDINLQRLCDIFSIKPSNFVNNPFKCLCGLLTTNTYHLLLHKHNQNSNQVVRYFNSLYTF